MNLYKFEQQIGGSFNLNKVSDCRKIIEMFIARESSSVQHREELESLAELILKDSFKAMDLAETILRKTPKKPIMAVISGMSREITAAEELDDRELVGKINEGLWGDLDSTSQESALLEELIRRFEKK